MTNIELKPCPFCGGNARIYNGGAGNNFVMCDDCKSTSDDCSKDRAVEKWNTRAAPKVKPLEWVGMTWSRHELRSLNDLYRIKREDGAAQYYVSFASRPIRDNTGCTIWHDCIEEAKDAAQSDYERRILSALENTQ